MNIRTIKQTTFTLMIGLLVVLYSPIAHAQETLPLQISPTRQEIEAAPGETVTFNVKFFNFGESPTSGLLRVSDFVVDNSEGNPRIIENTAQASPRFSGAQWLTLPYDRMSIPAQDSVTVQAEITVPVNARPGGRYVSVYYEPVTGLPDTEGTIREAGSSVAPRIGSLVFIKVTGPITEKAHVSRLFAPTFLEYGPINVEADILNRGDYHIRPRGSVTLRNMFGAAVEQQQLEENNIFPDALRTYMNEVGQKWMFGQYTLEVKAAYGDSGQIIERSVQVWVFPWKVVAAIALAIIILILVVRYIYKNHIQKEARLEAQLKKEHEEVERLKKEVDEQ